MSDAFSDALNDPTVKASRDQARAALLTKSKEELVEQILTLAEELVLREVEGLLSMVEEVMARSQQDQEASETNEDDYLSDRPSLGFENIGKFN